ncbi:MAG: class I SAM-dependent methyltransferase [Candidatus Omnitrophota bacterium]
MILKDLSPNRRKKTIELGSGSGNFKEYKPEALASDIEPCPWLDIAFDAHAMPFKKDSAGNIVMIDVLHHLEDPLKFFEEASNVLEPGGRIVIIEPFPTLFSLFVYKRFHPEPFIMDAPLSSLSKGNNQTENDNNINNIKKDPWDSNQAIAYLLFFKHRKEFLRLFGEKFKIVKRKRMSCILYPASGGFENKSLIPNFLIPVFKLLEILLTPLRRLLAFRCYIVLIKN